LTEAKVSLLMMGLWFPDTKISERWFCSSDTFFSKEL